jgi:S1-C subfamily serine protease
MVTARHVIQGHEPSDIIALSIYNEKIKFTEIVCDEPGGCDIAILKPACQVDRGLELGDDDRLRIGEQIATLGFPYLGNSTSMENERTIPLLSMGFLSGYGDYADDVKPIKYYIINGGVTIGNSGSPMFKVNDEKVMGMVVRKFTQFTTDMAPELAAHDPEFIAGVVNMFNIVSPSMMYSAICVSELKKLLLTNNIPL